MLTMPWIVVKFIQTEEVEAVPSSWLIDKEKGIVLWPPFHRTMMEKAIRNETVPCTDWKEYQIKVMSGRFYDSFSLASSMASKACDTSELESTLPEKRISKKTFKCAENSSDDSSDDLLSPKPFYSGTKAKDKNQTKDTQSEIHKDVSNDKLEIEPTVSKSKCTASIDAEFKKTSIALLLKNEMLIKDCDRKVDELSTKMEELKIMIAKLMDSSAESSEQIHTKKTTIMNELPIDSDECFEKLNRQLEDTGVFNDTVEYLYRIGGTDYKECSRRFLKKALTDAIAAQYSLHGHKKKKVFAISKIYAVISTAVQKCDKAATLRNVELVVAQWLAKAPERLKKNQLMHTTIEIGE